jgi:hypothetical protein
MDDYNGFIDGSLSWECAIQAMRERHQREVVSVRLTREQLSRLEEFCRISHADLDIRDAIDQAIRTPYGWASVTT